MRRTAVTLAASLAASLALLAGGVAVAPTAPAASTPAAAAAPAGGGVTARDACLASVPDPGGTAPVEICYTIFKPARASARRPVPMVMHSHGWGGQRAEQAEVQAYLDAGYGVLTFDQRGFGESGGHAHVENPALEGRDVRALVGVVARLPWVRQDGPGDPRLGAVGGSYGGGYQYLGAFELLRTRGTPVFDALVPQITWHDLSQSLAPNGVVRTEWALALSAASLLSDALPPTVYKALIEGAALGVWPDGSIPGTEDMVRFFRKNGPKWHVDRGRRLDIPMLLGQGTTDGLFPLEQGFRNWRSAMTARARERSIFVGYNGGHVLPAILPAGTSADTDPCSRKLAGGDFEKLSVRFLDHVLRGRPTSLRGFGRMHLATPGDRCTTITSPAANTTRKVGTVATLTGVGTPLSYPVAAGPIRVAGTPYLTGQMTALGVQNRAFYGLAVGTSPLDARLVQNNVLPIDEPAPVLGERRRVALPSVAVDVPKGQNLYLMVTPVSDTFLVMGSRLPGVVTIEDTVVHLPVVGR
ncbi:alpha/beta fold hydrolase [Nocardioides marmotae]|uniref:Peptidase S15 n=1 Tax=Nocardioides marmotae TaxID=2663857 RepID=A0A6I3IY92_9ACTN|nr:alpha/beta fold hydrolase [Nocardioides marmotae]MCR6030402.1 peptidase S15 [Gordonia jinghuaiqii]MBC9734533.1 peptidase S15 [Nocardioides marmotae]MTB85634.1 peptidase S15 [Nocardioides marmotae]MTB94037.1 peptidase S15 [Nocardioides marmotae]QKE00346.1 peptidase S15 [Nocardioides marmotae]